MALNSWSNLIRVSCSAAFMVAVSLSTAPALAQDAACAPPVTVETAPPPLPTYEQPPIPAPGYIWTPGSWAWNSDEEDYYWVPGTWVEPPRPGLLWTPGYWGWVGGSFLFHQGYWGPHVGFYGGVSYGFGYTGNGYEGGHWDHGAFFYNRTVNNFGAARITNVYEKTVVVNNTVNNISYNGGKDGVEAKPTAEQKTYAKENHFAPTAVQRQHVEGASKDPALLSKENKGRPPIAATSRPNEFKGAGVVPAKEPGEKNPGVTAPAAEEKKPTPEMKTPEPQPRPAVEEKKEPGVQESKPPVEEMKRPDAQENKPPVEEKRPVVDEKKPRIEERKPAAVDQRPDIVRPVERPAFHEPPKAEAHPAPPPPAHPAPPMPAAKPEPKKPDQK